MSPVRIDAGVRSPDNDLKSKPNILYHPPMNAPVIWFTSLSMTVWVSATQSPGLPEGVQDTQPDGQHPLSPNQSLERMRVPEGFQVSLFAAEPDIHQPIAFDFDERGRLWAIECFSYPEFDFRNSDRVVIFTDTDNDGQHDERTVFWDEGDRLTGIQVGFGGVWLTAPPNLLFIPDRDRDDSPDGPPEIKLDGFTLEANHNFVNGLVWAPDGWLWGRHGILAESRPGKPGTPASKRPRLNCGLWRYHPIEETFEVLAHGTTNPWGLDFDDHGQAFFSNNVIGHLWHLVPGARYERMFGNDYNPYSFDLLQACSDHLHWTGSNWREARGGQAHDAQGGGHSHSGGMIYLAENWPTNYRGAFFLNNIHGNRMMMDRLERHQSGYVARCGGTFLSAEDRWFRGITIKYGPDGGVFVTDWNDLGECHDNDGAYRSSGRIYKIVYGDSPQLPPFDLASDPDLELARNLLHENEWYVRQSRRLLQERALDRGIAPAALSFLRATLQSHPRIPRQLRALWALWVIDELTQNDLQSLLFHPNEHLRHWAIRLLSDRRNISSSTLALLTRFAAQEESSLVRLAYAAALQTLPTDQRSGLAQSLIGHADDGDDQNLPMMIWYGIEPTIAAQPESGIRLLKACRIPKLRQNIARRIASAGLRRTP